MKRLLHIETLKGSGELSGESTEPITVGYELLVSQWVHQIESADGVFEAPGTYLMEVTLTVPPAATGAIVSLVAATSATKLVLEDGREAEVLLSNTGDIFSTSPRGRIRCRVNSLEGRPGGL